MTVTVKIGNTTLPTPKASGLDFAREKIWSSDAGRTASGGMVGTVTARKWTVSLSWPRLTAANALTILNAEASGDFVTLTITGLGGSAVSKTGYFSTPTYTLVRGGVVDNLTMQFIEQ